MEISNHEVILTINLEGCLAKTASDLIRTHQLRSSRAYTANDGYMRAITCEKVIKRPRRVIELTPQTIKKIVHLSEAQVNWFVSFEARPTKQESSKEFVFWMRIKPIQRLDYYCRLLAADDHAVSYDFEII